MTAATLALGFGGIILGVVAGEFVARRYGGTARVYGDLSQALYAAFMLVIVFALAFAGGIYTIIAILLTILYYSIFRTRTNDVRRKINGG
ncbi:hypothetical protein [Haloferax sulfurifontis]|uniref:Uncharacterized protein n=2 Tax=Haloferax sulfurifontis TaxID=255616 RepID=M0IIL2_9EURY|nr:hypothetical protein [Haloferax sulfurifontis]ELZ96585.1 hypothetical protein C441_04434 [Haloferax sulfurifontis ATCC BAA-897]GGC72669.1 hypothetical protein GCM10007209_38280 [Haloferax sulfurifontis]